MYVYMAGRVCFDCQEGEGGVERNLLSFFLSSLLLFIFCAGTRLALTVGVAFHE